MIEIEQGKVRERTYKKQNTKAHNRKNSGVFLDKTEI